MNTFATIALSTTSGWSPHNKHSRPATPPSQRLEPIEQSLERPAKRARSEKLPSPPWVRAQSDTASRPVTSYESLADSRTMDAELLLNFSHEARFSTPTTMAQPYALILGRYYPATKPTRAEESSPRTLDLDSVYHPSSHGMESQPHRMEAVIAHGLPGTNRDAPAPCSKPPAKDVKLTFSPEIAPHDLRHQLIGASESEHHPPTSSGSELARSNAALHQLQQGESDPYAANGYTKLSGSPAQQDQTSSRGAHEECSQDGVAQPEVGDAVEKNNGDDFTIEPSPGIQKGQILIDSYRPSMLGTTIEQSISFSKVGPNQALEDLGSSTPCVRPILGSDIAEVPSALEPAICAACNFTRNSMRVEADSESTSWICCDGCKSWFHFACAGFKSEREVRAVDKYRCRSCKKIHGPTTYVRKSTRAHTAIDYAGLNQGVIKTSDERPEHHYIKPIKDGTISIQPENFARMRPELVTAEHFEKGNGMKEPIVIPAGLNPRPGPAGFSERSVNVESKNQSDAASLEDWFTRDPECRNVPDHGQDALDMVIPQNLSVRKVAELYGPEEKIEVIDVKSQNGEGKKWNMKRWADYYEHAPKKVVRNVISLEVSQSTLGRLIRRPQIVRDLDLQDSVWPAELQAKGEYPHVQFYCLMSVADCFTDFHIDFGGSSVFYHILKGKKTFFFIPPKEKHLKKYEGWCMSPAQNWTFLGDQTKECYRVDLSEGDTMLIPAGWIHAVWTPEDSLVIGGNFLTRLNYSMQLRIAQVEKATGVARKFRYPHFQKIQWYTAIRYLESDPLPTSVRSALEAGGLFHRQYPAYHDFNTWGENSRSGPENYHARYYSQPELEGLPDLTRYLLRTALIDSGEIIDGITVDARNAVKKSIPRGFGEPLEIVKSFAIWCAWKRGNEAIPHWAHADAIRENGMPESAAKLSGAALKKLDCEAVLQAPRRQSARNQLHQVSLTPKGPETSSEWRHPSSERQPENSGSSQAVGFEPLPGESSKPYQTSLVDGKGHGQSGTPIAINPKRRKSAPGPGTGSQRKTACESCRRRRRACKHKTELIPQNPPDPYVTSTVGEDQEPAAGPYTAIATPSSEAHTSRIVQDQANETTLLGPCQDVPPEFSSTTSTSQSQQTVEESVGTGATEATMPDPSPDARHVTGPLPAQRQQTTPRAQKTVDQTLLTSPQGRGRSKACNDCRKSKRRCLHDEHGQEDPVKIRDAAHPRSAPASKRRKLEGYSQDTPVRDNSHENQPSQHVFVYSVLPNTMLPSPDVLKTAPMAVSIADVPPENAGVGTQSASAALHEQQASPQLYMAIDPVPNQPSPAIGQVRAKNLTPPSVPEQDATEVQTDAQGSIENPGHAAIEQVTATPTNAFRYEMTAHVDSGGNFGHPAASSLVSPPASSHDESEQPNTAAEAKLTYSEISSRHSSRHPAQTQRFTPESGPTRRDSSSSVVVDTLAAAATKSLGTSSPVSTGQAPDSAQKRMKATLHSETVADEESLKLIRTLQAQDYGLRRRGRAA
ncbi:MAG: hypothetical protein Q9166_006141 [cf. Caloplaca sp. 2 TL-2023]